MSIALRSCGNGVGHSRLLLHQNSRYVRYKYTAPSLMEVVNKKRSKFHAFVQHKAHEVSKARVELLKLKNIEKQDAGCRQETTLKPEAYDLTSLQSQMSSLRTKGFLRAYRPYTPPEDVRTRFLEVCSRVLEQPVEANRLRQVKLDSAEIKFRVLSALSAEFGGHAVHNSRLHEIKNLGNALLFYESAVCCMNPYELLHQEQEAGNLPPNLCIQENAVRFTGTGDHPLDKVTAYPRTRTLVVGLKTKEKYSSLEPEVHPWEDMDYK